MKIIWNSQELDQVESCVKQFITEGKYKTSVWGDILFRAQRVVLPRHRWRERNSLNVHAWRDTKTQEIKWGHARWIIFQALKDLQLVPMDQPIYKPFPTRADVLAMKQVSVTVPTVEIGCNPTDNSGTVVKWEPTVAAAPVAPKWNTLEQVQQLIARVNQLEAELKSVTDFVTSHGYRP